MFDTINEYASVVNLALFAAILGLLVPIVRFSRTALQDKHDSEIVALEAEKASLNSRLQNQKENFEAKLDRLQNQKENFEAKLDLLERQLSFFQRLADLPKDKQVETLKHQYELRIHEQKVDETRLEGGFRSTETYPRVEPHGVVDRDRTVQLSMDVSAESLGTKIVASETDSLMKTLKDNIESSILGRDR